MSLSSTPARAPSTGWLRLVLVLILCQLFALGRSRAEAAPQRPLARLVVRDRPPRDDEAAYRRLVANARTHGATRSLDEPEDIAHDAWIAAQDGAQRAPLDEPAMKALFVDLRRAQERRRSQERRALPSLRLHEAARVEVDPSCSTRDDPGRQRRALRAVRRELDDVRRRVLDDWARDVPIRDTATAIGRSPTRVVQLRLDIAKRIRVRTALPVARRHGPAPPQRPLARPR